LTTKADKEHDYSVMHLQSNMSGFPTGFRLYPGHFDRDAQVDLLAAVRDVLDAAPLFVPRHVWGANDRLSYGLIGTGGWLKHANDAEITHGTTPSS